MSSIKVNPEALLRGGLGWWSTNQVAATFADAAVAAANAADQWNPTLYTVGDLKIEYRLWDNRTEEVLPVEGAPKSILAGYVGRIGHYEGPSARDPLSAMAALRDAIKVRGQRS